MGTITFRRWLKLQKWRDDPVGDLARDLIDDKCSRYLRTYKSIRRHVLFHTFDLDVREALVTAKKEYVEFLKSMKDNDGKKD